MRIDKFAIITGAGHRLGRALALCLARKGYSILVHYNTSHQKAKETLSIIESLGVPGTLLHADLSTFEGMTNFINKIDEILSSTKIRPAILINSAAVMGKEDENFDQEDNWEKTFTLNLRAPYFLSTEIAKRMGNKGIIVNISDVGARNLWTSYPEYVLSKSGLETMTRLLAKRFAPNIRVNAIAPGLIIRSKNIQPSEWRKLINRLPLKRATTPDEIEATLEFIINNQAITGQIITVDCGFSLLC